MSGIGVVDVIYPKIQLKKNAKKKKKLILNSCMLKGGGSILLSPITQSK